MVHNKNISIFVFFLLFYFNIDKNSLRNLKMHLAEDGCSEVQYELGRQLLEENSENDANDGLAQGVNWLLRAAQQGHDGALKLLEDCFKDKRGITDSNECEVRSCISMSPGERAARKAAHELFACLSNGEEYITATQLETRMRKIYNLQKNRKDSLNENLKCGLRPSSPPINRIPRSNLSNPELLTEENIVDAAVTYSNGHLPTVSNALVLSTPNPQTLDHVPCFHRPIFHPIQFFSLLYHRFIKIMSSFPGNMFTHFQFIIILLIYSIFANDNLFDFFPVGAYYITLIIMIISSFKMLKIKHDFIDFRIWSGLFLSYGNEHIDVENSEHQFIKNNLKPYFYFFTSFIVNIMLHPFIINDNMILHSEITVISFVLIFVTMFAFMYTTKPCPDYLILFSFGVNVLAKYPYEMDEVVITGWRFLDLKVPTFSSFVIGNGIEFCLNCRTLLYLIIPGFLFYMARSGNNWRGIYRYLIPHCVTLSWLQVCIVSSQCATMFGLVRATLGLAGLLLFLPLFGIVTLLIPIFATFQLISFNDPNIRLCILIVTAVFAIIVSCAMAASNRTGKYITILQITICIVATVFLTFPYMTSNFNAAHSPSIYENLVNSKTEQNADDIINPSLTWSLYYKYCHQPAWEHLNKVKTQLRCSHLDNTPVKWEGTVIDIEISKISNFRMDLIKNYLPNTFAEFMMCFYGEKNKVNCGESEDCEEMKSFLDDQKYCNLNKWNR